MNQAIMQGPSVCVLILQQAAFLAAEWEVVIQRKSAGGEINENSNFVMFFVGIQHVSMLNKNLARCELHTNSYIIVMILSKYFFTIIQYNKGWRVGVGGW